MTLSQGHNRQHTFMNNVNTQNLIITAQLKILNKMKIPIKCRTLIDTCSTANLMTEQFADQLGIRKIPYKISIGALNMLSTTSKYITTATIQSNTCNYQKTLTFLLVPMIAETIPTQSISRNSIHIPHNIKLADPEFYKSAPVQLLLGTGVALSILSVGQIKLQSDYAQELYLQKTTLGWIIGGSANVSNPSANKTFHISTPILFDLAKFWEIENYEYTNRSEHEEDAAIIHYKTHTRRDSNGRYILALPFTDKKNTLGQSRSLALKRLTGIDKKLARDVKLKDEYYRVLQEYIDLGHMSPVNKIDTDNCFYLPHHPVIKMSSTTTKVRVVFDASAKTTSGASLNDILLTGPTLQADLFSILIKFRTHKYVITGDIEKMYRQFLVRPEDRDYQRIIWRNADGNIQDYTLNTVTFGVTSAPFMAIKTLHQLSEDEGHDFPLAAQVLKNDFYVDDLLSGSSTISEGIELRQQLTKLLSRGQLTIRQWASNHMALLNGLSADQINTHLSLNDTDTLKTLGVYWNSKKDVFTYTIHSTINPTSITKRHILSETAKIFDPLGLLAPVIIIAKIMIQQLWSLDLSWDESLPNSIHTEWINYQEQLKILNNLEFNRNIRLVDNHHVQLHGFCDASQKAYGACLYTRSVDQQGKIIIELICAKSRVAPLKPMTIPRLELCGAKLLTSLFNTVKNIIPVEFENIYLWTDSTIVLHWLNTSPQKLKTFVANRVIDIQNSTKIEYWRHVHSQDNPADLISRGVTADQLIHNKKWKSGPEWLSASDSWPPPFINKSIDVPEIKPEQCFTTISHHNNTFDILSKYSSIAKLQRIIAYCLRMKLKRSTTPYINVHEFQHSMKLIIRLLQKMHFQEEIQDIKSKRALKSNSKLKSLNPIIDHDQILRVGGRLQNSNLNSSAQHPIILPKNDHVTDLIIRQEHQINGHTGVQTTLYLLRRKYWIIDGRSQVWKIVKSCVKCCKVNPSKVEYLMGNLPTPRVNESRPFTHVGIDYCGPFILKQKKFKNRVSMKVYVAVFICLAIKAVHLEVVSNLTTEAFIAALRRFISRRGTCAHIYSDNGTTFVGAQNELKKIISQLHMENNHKQIAEFLMPHGIE